MLTRPHVDGAGPGMLHANVAGRRGECAGLAAGAAAACGLGGCLAAGALILLGVARLPLLLTAPGVAAPLTTGWLVWFRGCRGRCGLARGGNKSGGGWRSCVEVDLLQQQLVLGILERREGTTVANVVTYILVLLVQPANEVEHESTVGDVLAQGAKVGRQTYQLAAVVGDVEVALPGVAKFGVEDDGARLAVP